MIKHKELHEETDLWRKLHTILRQLPHKEQVQFALFCAEEANSELPVAKKCIHLVKSWLKDPKSVTSKELRQSADSAFYAASFSANAAYTAAWASAYATYAVSSDS